MAKRVIYWPKQRLAINWIEHCECCQWNDNSIWRYGSAQSWQCTRLCCRSYTRRQHEHQQWRWLLLAVLWDLYFHSASFVHSAVFLTVAHVQGGVYHTGAESSERRQRQNLSQTLPTKTTNIKCTERERESSGPNRTEGLLLLYTSRSWWPNCTRHWHSLIRPDFQCYISSLFYCSTLFFEYGFTKTNPSSKSRSTKRY